MTLSIKTTLICLSVKPEDGIHSIDYTWVRLPLSLRLDTFRGTNLHQGEFLIPDGGLHPAYTYADP
jgi:hypothetical protein